MAGMVSAGEDPAGGERLTSAFFERDPSVVARQLIGCTIVSRCGGSTVGGRIVETEAYLGSDDPGSHASTRGITKRNAVMYGPPGCLYVYFTYGNHHMLNLVCEPEGTAGAVLVRAIEPTIGLPVMRERRAGRADRELANGPGKLAAALGVNLSDDGSRLDEGAVSVLRGELLPGERVATSGRIGLSSGHDLELRYYLDGNRHVSKGRTGPVRRTR